MKRNQPDQTGSSLAAKRLHTQPVAATRDPSSRSQTSRDRSPSEGRDELIPPDRFSGALKLDQTGTTVSDGQPVEENGSLFKSSSKPKREKPPPSKRGRNARIEGAKPAKETKAYSVEIERQPVPCLAGEKIYTPQVSGKPKRTCFASGISSGEIKECNGSSGGPLCFQEPNATEKLNDFPIQNQEPISDATMDSPLDNCEERDTADEPKNVTTQNQAPVVEAAAHNPGEDREEPQDCETNPTEISQASAQRLDIPGTDKEDQWLYKWDVDIGKAAKKLKWSLPMKVSPKTRDLLLSLNDALALGTLTEELGFKPKWNTSADYNLLRSFFESPKPFVIARTTPQDSERNTPLHLAAWLGLGDALEKLLQWAPFLGRDYVNARNYYKATPLLLGTQRLPTKGLNLLLDHGADVNAVDSKGYSVLDYVLDIWDKEKTQLILRRGADVKGGKASKARKDRMNELLGQDGKT